MDIKDLPLTTSDIMIGGNYIWATVEHGCLNVALIRILDYNPSTKVFLVEYNYDSGSYRRLVSAVRFDGYKPGDAKPVYGQVFNVSSSLIDKLRLLVRAQDVTAWLTHLGVDDPVRLAAKIQAPLPPIQPELPGLEPPAPPPVAVKEPTPSPADVAFHKHLERIRALVPESVK